MGEMADDMIEGHSCSWCGVYFRKPHGYPVLCWGCWKDSKKEDREGIQRSLQKDG